MIERINLVPQKPLAEKIKTALPIVLSSLLAVVALVSAGQYWLLNFRGHEADTLLNELSVRKERLDLLQSQTQALRGAITRLRDEQSRLTARLANFDIATTGSNSFSEALARITGYLPDSVRCTKILLDSKNGQISGEAVDYNDLPELVSKLQSDSFFQKATIKNVDKNSDGRWYRFRFTIELQLN